jgi:hypothetical protein
MRLRQLHLIIGAATLHGMADGPRLLYRSAHIYLLLTGLCHVALGLHLAGLEARRSQILQMAGSSLLCVAPVLLGLSFFGESVKADLIRPVASLGIIATTGGVLLHALAAVVAARTRSRSLSPGATPET